MSLRRRWRANVGWLTLVGLLTLTATVLITATPQMVNRYTDQGLREWIDSLSYSARDVSYVIGAASAPPEPAVAGAILEDLRAAMAPALRDRLSAAWYATQAGGVASGPDVARRQAEVGVDTFLLSVRNQSGAEEAVRLVDGEWPANPASPGDRIAVAASTAVARAYGLQVGSTVDIIGAGPTPALVRIVGIFEPLDPDAPIWAEEPKVLTPATPIGTFPPEPWNAVVLTDTAGMGHAVADLGVSSMTWRFRLDETTITAADLPAVAEAVLDARTQPVVRASTVTSLDSALADFARTEASARALVTVVQAGLAATLFGLVVLAALAATERRRGELQLLRARGASLVRVGGRLLVESAPIVAVAVGLGYAVAALVPGRPGGQAWLAVVFAVGAALTAPVLAMARSRRGSVTAARSDLARPRLSPRRLTAELTIIVLAVAGVVVLRQRSLGQQVDMFLALLPVLVGVAAALVALRLLPYPVRLLTAAAAKARGAVTFLGLAGAGRASAASGAPVVVLVVAVSVGTLCAAAAGSIAAARDRVAEIHVPGDAIVTGVQFPPSLAQEIAAAPGVTAVAPMAITRNHALFDGQDHWVLTGVTSLVVDAPALDRVLGAADSTRSVPDVLLAAPAEGAPMPAVVSPDVAEALGGANAVGQISLRNRVVPFTVAAVVESFPGLAQDPRFLVVPWSALPAPVARDLAPTGFVLAGEAIDLDAVADLSEAAQRAWISERSGRLPEDALEFHAVSYDQARAGLERAGIDPVLDLTFAVGLGAGLLFALLAVGFAVATGARARGQALSRLRTMGLTTGQGRALLAWELLPLIVSGAVVGSAVGAVLPVLLGPALGLSAFSDGGEVLFRLDLTLPGLTLGLVLVALVTSIVVEASLNRRAGLGSVLRVGRES
jgi:putative ABC transport system permease protein